MMMDDRNRQSEPAAEQETTTNRARQAVTGQQCAPRAAVRADRCAARLHGSVLRTLMDTKAPPYVSLQVRPPGEAAWDW